MYLGLAVALATWYNIASLNENSDEFKYTLVHEFTHLFDYFIQSKSCDNDFIKRNLMLYTEYHAVEIEILFCYQIIDKITDNADFMKTDLTKILNLPYKKNETYAATAINFYKDKSLQNFHAMKTAYMYSCGSSAILSQLLDRNIRTIEFIDPYKPQMKQVINLLHTVKYYENPSRELLKRIGDLNAQINYFNM